MSDGTELSAEHLAAPFAPPATSTLREAERAAIAAALAATGGHRKQAAERLGIGERTLYDKIKEYGLS